MPSRIGTSGSRLRSPRSHRRNRDTSRKNVIRYGFQPSTRNATPRSRAHAQIYARGLAGCPSIETPYAIPEVEHVYYQYCIYVSDPCRTRRRAIRRGVDFETTHVDVCSALPLFKQFAAACPQAEQTAEALQLPVYSRLRTSDVERVLKVVLEVSADLAPLHKKAGASVSELELVAPSANAMRAN